MASKRTQDKGKRAATSDSQPRKSAKTRAKTTGNLDRTAVTWTAEEMKSLQILQKTTVHSTRFADRGLLGELGLLKDFDDLMMRMGLQEFAIMDFPTYEVLTREFLATVNVEYEKPQAKTAKEGRITFKIGNRGYNLSIFDICEVYKFPKRPLIKFPLFADANTFWAIIGDDSDEYIGSAAKIALVRNPVLRYAAKLMGNTFFARKEINAVKKDELNFLFQGLKHVVRNGDGELLQDNFENNINYGAVFASELTSYRQVKNPYLAVGGVLTPLFEKAGIDLAQHNPNPERKYMDLPYLIRVNTLFTNPNGHPPFIYVLSTPKREPRKFLLPNTSKTSLTSHEKVEFDLKEEYYYNGGWTGRDGLLPAQTPPQEEDEFGFPDLPDLDFAPRTPREKYLFEHCKAQGRFNKWAKKMIGKLMRKFKKTQPPDYVSSEEEEGDTFEEAPQGGQGEDGPSYAQPRHSYAAAPSSSHDQIEPTRHSSYEGGTSSNI